LVPSKFLPALLVITSIFAGYSSKHKTEKNHKVESGKNLQEFVGY
jgi:hypothetical protein